MTETEELRRLLDERGVEWRADDGKTAWATRWVFDGHSSAMFSEYDDGECVFVTSRHSWTPEQAVAATLGRGTCHDVDTRFDAWTCSECKCTQLLIFDEFFEPAMSVDGVASVPSYCPNCGRKVAE